MAIAPPQTTAVHRCRFVDWNPSAITALAFAPLYALGSTQEKQSQETRFGTLAVGRANGTIEICSWTGAPWQDYSPQGWVVEQVFAAPSPSKVDTLAFVLKDPRKRSRGSVPALSELRLFSTSGSKDLLEWSVLTGHIINITDSEGGAIWSISPNPSSTILALGCEDGSIRLLTLADDSTAPLKRLDRAKTRILSIAWGKPIRRAPTKKVSSDSDDDDDEDDVEEWTDKWLVAGCTDSSIRKWDVETGRVVERMTTDKVKGEKTLVWAIAVLGDGTIVSGDSLGTVRFWDAMTSTQLHTFQAHGADVLCLALGPDGTSVYSSGVDQKIAEFSTVQVAQGTQSSSSRWIHTRARRMHTHDVRALAIWPPFSPLLTSKSNSSTNYAPVLASGGLDMTVSLTPCAPPSSTTRTVNPLSPIPASSFEDAYYRKIPYGGLSAGGGGIVQLAKTARYVLCRRDTGVSIWKLDAVQIKSSLTNQDGWERLLDMELKVETTLVASAISDNGEWLAVSDAYETKLFKLVNDESSETQLQPIRSRDLTNILHTYISSVSPSAAVTTGASVIEFTPDSLKMVLAINSLVIIIDLNAAATAPQSQRLQPVSIIGSFTHHRANVGVKTTSSAKPGRIVKPLKGVPTPAPEPAGATNDEDEDMSSEDEDSSLSASTASTGSWPAVSRMAVSADGQWLATTDLWGRTHVFNVDSSKHHCTLPTSPLFASALVFDPILTQTLFLGFPNNTLQIFDVEARQTPDWAQSFNSWVPKRLGSLREPLVGIAFPHSTQEGQRDILLWGPSWLCKVQISGTTSSKKSKFKMKRKQAGANGRKPHTEDENVFKTISKYRDLLFVDVVGPGELVVVERPLIEILHTLPPAYFKSKYGRG